jgi:hypothetical protein
VVLYVGDWDPSGLYMSEDDLPARLHRYRVNAWIEHGINGAHAAPFDQTAITIVRVALSAEDVAEPTLPSFPLDTKRGDPRHGWYRAAGYGPRCWELDALSPVVLRARTEAAIFSRLDAVSWARYADAERVERESIVATVRTWRGLIGAPA